MAKQKGTVQFTGRVGDLIFYDSPYGILVRGVGSLDKKRIAKDPAFALTRNTGSEFSRVSKGGRLLRHAVKRHLPNAGQHSTNYRLNKVLVAALQKEAVHGHGQRLLSCTDLSGLKGFEWNEGCPFSAAYSGGLKTVIDRAAGTLSLDASALNFKQQLKAPAGATHAQLIAVGLAPDFEADTCAVSVAEGELWGLANGKGAAQTLSCQLQPRLNVPLIMAVGLRAFQEVSGQLYGLKGGDALTIADVDY